MLDRETIIRLAREAYLYLDGENTQQPFWVLKTEDLERFAAFVAAAEREQCAQVCDGIDTEYEGEDVLATWCAAAIRARSNHE